MPDNGINADQLIAFAERRANLEEDKAGVAEDIKELKAEVKNAGFEAKWFEHCFKLRSMDPDARAEKQTMQDLYLEALGLSTGGDSDVSGDVNSDELNAFLDRRARLEEEKADVAEQIKELNAEIKSAGYELAHFNYAYAQKQMDPSDRQEQLWMRETYERAAGL